MNRYLSERGPSAFIALIQFTACYFLFNLLLFTPPLLSSAEAKRSKAIKTLAASAPMSSPTLSLLTSEERSALKMIRADPPPEEIVRNSHYWVSNEHNHQLWLPFIRGIGGAFVGVGTDQNYLLAGWAKSNLLILMDFDQEISNLHETYAFFFSISETPKMLIDRWSRAYGEDSARKLAEHFKPIAQELATREASKKGLSEKRSVSYIKRRVKRYIKRRVKIFKRTRGLLWRRLTKTRKKYVALKIPTFLDDQAQYDHIRSLWATGRVIAIRGDLTADYTMLDLAEALRTLGETLNVLYLSNAEQYFPLTPTYRRNLIHLPWGATSYALRTMGWRSLGFFDEDEKYHYNVQSGPNLVTWMKESNTNKAGRMMFKGREIKEPGFSVMNQPPPKSKKRPEIEELPK